MPTTRDADQVAAVRDADRVELILSQIEQLPTLPAVAARVLQTTSSPDSSASDVVALIEADQALTAKILSLIGRSDLGVGREVSTVARAVVLLGFAAVRNAVLSIQIYETFGELEPGEDAALDRSEFWKHSLAVACSAQLIAQRTKLAEAPPDEAFVCGLLHDLGKMALDACLPKSYARIVRETDARRCCICDVEKAVLGLDHTVAGRRLAGHWKLPQNLVECIWLHHHPPASLPASLQAAKLVEIVHLADHLVRRQRIGYSGYNRVADIPTLAAQLGLADEDVDAVVADLGPLVEQNCHLVGFTELTTSDLYTKALGEANRELSRVNADLARTNRRLEMRSRCFDALRSFAADLVAESRVVDACRAAARCLRQALDTDCFVACFAVNETQTMYHVGTTLEHGEVTAVVIPAAPVALPSAPTAGRLAEAHAWVEPVRERFSDALGDEPAWMLPISHSNRLVGGVLVAMAADQAARFEPFADELEALATAFGLAIATATAHANAETVIEELADVNRRLHAAQEEILRSKSLAMISEMAAGAAHELNNPLAVISGRAQMLAHDLEGEPQHKSLTTIHEQAQRASQIVSELIAFAKPAPPIAETISLQPWLLLLREQWVADSSLSSEAFEIRLSDPSVTVRADSDQLTDIFSALIANAVEATTPENARLIVNSASRASDDTVVVTVEDNGAGMSSAVLEHALDPFFSHRTAGRGRGLGLSRAYSLALANGGRLWLESTLGTGTTVFVELPAGRRE